MKPASPDDLNSEFLPSSQDIERLVLGACMTSGESFSVAREKLGGEDFFLHKHQVLWAAMLSIGESKLQLDRITLIDYLNANRKLELVDGISYVVSLDEGLPEIAALDSYISILRKKTGLRKLVALSRSVQAEVMSDDSDPKDISRRLQDTLFASAEVDNVDDLSSGARIIEQFTGGINAFLDPSKRARGLMTGFTKYDHLTGGLHSGELTILAARPGVGKTACAMNIAAHVVLSTVPQPVAVFSVEMSKESLFSRMVCCEARVDSAKFRDGYLNSDERRRLQKAANRLSAAPLFIRDGSATLTAIYNKSRKLQQEHGLGLVVVDYLQLMTGKGKAERRDLEVGAMSRGLKLMAGELRVPVLALSQVSRAPEARTGNHRPQLSDLRESGNLEQDADNVAFIFRPEMYNRDREDLRGVAEVILDKQRNGATGVAHLVWLREYTKFENRASDLAEPQADMFSAANQHLYTDVG